MPKKGYLVMHRGDHRKYLRDPVAAARRIRPAGLAFFISGSLRLAMHSTTSGFNVFSVGSTAVPSASTLRAATMFWIANSALSSNAGSVEWKT